MRRHFIFIATIAVLASAFSNNITAQEDYVLKEVLVVERGKLKRLKHPERIQEYVTCRKGSELVPVRIRTGIAIDDCIMVNGGANAKLELSGEELVWLNYNTTVHRESDGIKLDSGEAYVRGAKFRLFGNRLRPIQTGTEFYLRTNRDIDRDLLYVFEGEVKATNGKAWQVIEKDKAIQAPKEDVIEGITLYKRDVERIERWRNDIRWCELSWLGRLVRWPKRHPRLSITTAAITTTAVICKIVYEVGQDNSELIVNVRF